MPREAKTLPPLSRTEQRNAAKASAALHDGRNAMSVDEAAEYLGMSSNTIRRLIRDRQLRSSKISGTLRIRPSDLDAYFEQHIAS